ncbi:MAG: hypothetical protein IPJ84_05665 [Bdellovibrionales bacterium]|nr:hypothetical protein [Bdellovibrionales bacterium]
MKNFKEMTLSQKRGLLASTGLPMVALVLMVGFQNCSPGVVQSTKVASTGVSGPSSLDLESDTKPVTVTYSENLVVSMQQLTGVETLSARAKTAATNALPKISETGKADTVNAPMWIAVTNLGAEICLDLITAEKAVTVADNRRFFNKIDFAQGATAITDAAKDDLIRRMARNFWGRNESVAEKTLLKSTLDAAMTEPAAANQSVTAETENALLFTCAAMLSSLDAIRF